jgi:hypothetical protein
MSTGPTGTQGFLVSPLNPLTFTIFPSAATGPVEPPYIATLDELMASREATLVKETADTLILSVLTNPTRDPFRASLFQWAAAGFEPGYVIHTLTIDTPPICADGEVRAIGGYIMYLTSKSPEQLCENLQAMMTGVRFYHSFKDNTIRIHVERA